MLKTTISFSKIVLFQDFSALPTEYFAHDEISDLSTEFTLYAVNLKGFKWRISKL